MKKTFLVALALVLVSGLILSGCAKPPSEGQEVNFPDENLEEWVRQALGKSAGEKITTTELAELTWLICPSSDITDLSGLEYCTSLTELDLAHNQISDVSPLANLTSLTELRLSHNQISDVSPLANLTNLTYLSLGDNPISDISPLANLTNLTTLLLASNQISDISPLTNLINLTTLGLKFNQISDISPLVENSGLGAGCRISIVYNNLDLAEGSEDIENIRALEVRGVEVTYIYEK